MVGGSVCNGGVQQTETEYGSLGSRIEETIIVEEGKAEERKETLQRDRERERVSVGGGHDKVECCIPRDLKSSVCIAVVHPSTYVKTGHICDVRLVKWKGAPYSFVILT